jgi:hypothetical protein
VKKIARFKIDQRWLDKGFNSGQRELRMDSFSPPYVNCTIFIDGVEQPERLAFLLSFFLDDDNLVLIEDFNEIMSD